MGSRRSENRSRHNALQADVALNWYEVADVIGIADLELFDQADLDLGKARAAGPKTWANCEEDRADVG